MWAQKKQTGFTIVETLIVLAVVGVLFLSTALLVQGQLDKYQQKDAIFQLESIVRNSLNDVSNGYYPDSGKGVDCSSSGTTITSGPSLKSSGSSADIGTNTQCVYAGKRITFTNNGIVVETLAAANSDTMPPLANMLPIDGLDQTISYKWGIKPTTASVDDQIWILNTAYGPQVSASNDSFVSGAQSVSLYSKDRTALVTEKTLCFENSGSNSALILTGKGGLQVRAEQKSSCT